MPHIPLMLKVPPNATKAERLDIAITNTTMLLKYSWPISQSNLRHGTALLQQLMWQADNMDKDIRKPDSVGCRVWYVTGNTLSAGLEQPREAIVIRHIERRWWRKEKFVIVFPSGETLKVDPIHIWVRAA